MEDGDSFYAELWNIQTGKKIQLLAAWYKNFGPASDVLEVGELIEPSPAKGEVKIRIHSSAVNPSDVKKDQVQALIFQIMDQ